MTATGAPSAHQTRSFDTSWVGHAAQAARPHARRLARTVLPTPVKRYVKQNLAARRRPPAPTPPPPPPASEYAHIPRDHARQVVSNYYIDEAMTGPCAPAFVVDLGCGNGASAQLFREHPPEVQWIGVDIEESDLAKAITDETVVLYDGINLPFADDSIPLIYSNQVFEHVRHPEPLLNEIRRVLTPGGVFIGSTSQLEPYHSWSLWGGYTIYGWRTLCRDAGLVVEEVRPSIDSVALITRQYEGALPHHNTWWRGSPMNAQIDEWAAETGADVFTTNARKLQFCGQFAFRVRKPLRAPGHVPLPAAPVDVASSLRGRLPELRRRGGRTLMRVAVRLMR